MRLYKLSNIGFLSICGFLMFISVLSDEAYTGFALGCEHLTRMEDVRLLNVFFYGKLQHSKHPRHKPKHALRMYFVKNNLKVLCVDVDDWEQMMEN